MQAVAATNAGGEPHLGPGGAPGRTGLTDRPRLFLWVGALLAFGIAAALFTRFSIDDSLFRDEAIYAYGGQQWAHGVPFEVSIFDPKGPGAAALLAIAALVAPVVHANDLYSMRVLFFLFACATVALVYVLGLRLFESPLAGLAAAVTFASFEGFAQDALGGPDAKTPGICFAVLAMLLLVRRRWFWGGLVGTLAFLVWQPLAIYAAVALLAALVDPGPERRRKRVALAAAGIAVPVVVTLVYYLLDGSLHALADGSLAFPLTGIKHGQSSVGTRLDLIATTVSAHYGATKILFYGGCVLLPALAVWRLLVPRPGSLGMRDPLVVVVIVSFAGLVLYSALDFQGYPDLYPLLPYAALGIGGTMGLVIGWARGARGRRALTVLGSLAVAVLVVLTWHWYSEPRKAPTRLIEQRAHAATINRLIGPHGTLLSMGDPGPLVLTHRRNPIKYIYLDSGVVPWLLRDVPGGFPAWTRRLQAMNPALIVVGSWVGKYNLKTERWLKRTYEERRIGRWQLFMPPATLQRARRLGIKLKAPLPLQPLPPQSTG